MTLPIVIAHHGVVLSIAFAGPVLAVGVGLAVLVLRDRRAHRREERSGR